MPVVLVFELRGSGARAKYEKSFKAVVKGRRKRPSDWVVRGLLMHAAGPIPGGWRVIDVWQSRAALNRFGKKLMPVMKQVGLANAKPKISSLKRFIK